MKIYGLEFLHEYKGEHRTNPKYWARPPKIPQIFERPELYLQKKSVDEFISKKKKGRTLILAGESMSVGYIKPLLRKLNRSFASINLDELIFTGRISYDEKKGFQLHHGKQVITIKNFDKVLFFPPQWLMGLDAHPEVLTVEEKILLNRWRVLVQDLEIVFPRHAWYPAPPRELLESSQQKLADLILAKENGLLTPETIVTMDVREAKKFVTKHKQVIFRDFGTRRVHKKNKLMTFQIEFVSAKAKSFEAIKAGPTVLQQYVAKNKEFRVVLVGKKVFVCEIDSQSGTESKKDWRAYEFGKVAFTEAQLPNNLLNKLKTFAALRGFRFCSFDIIESVDGDYYFLEMNRPGAWLFVEGLTGMKIGESLAKILS